MRRHPWSLAIGAAVGAALLVLLGVLQVRWLDQVAQTITAQKRAALLRQGTATALDLERELTRAFFWFQLEQRERTPPLPELLTARWRSWVEAAPHAALVSAVWLVEPVPAAEPRLRRLAGNGALESAAWPAALAGFRQLARDGLRLAGLLSIADGDSAWLALPAQPMEGPPEEGAMVLLQLDRRHLAQMLLPALLGGPPRGRRSGDRPAGGRGRTTAGGQRCGDARVSGRRARAHRDPGNPPGSGHARAVRGDAPAAAVAPRVPPAPRRPSRQPASSTARRRGHGHRLRRGPGRPAVAAGVHPAFPGRPGSPPARPRRSSRRRRGDGPAAALAPGPGLRRRAGERRGHQPAPAQSGPGLQRADPPRGAPSPRSPWPCGGPTPWPIGSGSSWPRSRTSCARPWR